MRKKSWRERLPVHPVADVFPMLSDEKLDELGADIRKNGLRNQIVLWRDTSSSPTDVGPAYVLDGRNRLEAMERVGEKIPAPEDESGMLSSRRVFTIVESHSWSSTNMGSSWRKKANVDPVAYVIGANIHRRHLTKAQQARLIVKAAEAAKTDLPNMTESVPRDSRGRVRGSRPDPVKRKAVAEAAKLGISETTVERALAEERANGATPVTRRRSPGRPRKRPLGDHDAKRILREIAAFDPSQLSDPAEFGARLIAEGNRLTAAAPRPPRGGAAGAVRL